MNVQSLIWACWVVSEKRQHSLLIDWSSNKLQSVKNVIQIKHTILPVNLYTSKTKAAFQILWSMYATPHNEDIMI